MQLPSLVRIIAQFGYSLQTPVLFARHLSMMARKGLNEVAALKRAQRLPGKMLE